MRALHTMLRGVVPVLLASPFAAAQVAWQEHPLMPAGLPPMRSTVMTAFHEQLGRTILFGGASATGPYLNDTWAWDGVAWQQRFPAASPPPTYYQLVYDAARGVVIALGQLAGWQHWEYDGVTWTQRTPAVAPPPRYGCGICDDRGRGRVVLFGGRTVGGFTYLNDTWEWDGTNWTQGSPTNTPSPRENLGLAFDPVRQRTLLLRGIVVQGPTPTFFNDQWEWDGANWTAMPTPSLPTSAGAGLTTHLQRNRVIAFDANTPATFWEWNGATWNSVASPQHPGFFSSPIPYDTARNRLVWFRSGTQPQLWEWDGATWLDLSPTPIPKPAPRCGHGMAFFLPSLRTVVFGGSNAALFTDTWEWDGANWTQRAPTMSPPGRFTTNMVEHTSRGEIVLFGGQGTGGGGLADTWVWNGTNWTQRTPAFSPSPRYGHSLAYDAARDRVVLFGGGVGAGDTTYEWDGVNWTQRFPAQRPSPRQYAAMAYDAARQRIVLFGGLFGLADTWEYDGTNWTQRFPATTPPAGYHMMAWDGSRTRIVMFGNLAQAWEWDGTNWTPRSTAPTPPQRAQGGFAYDPIRARLVLFSGINAGCKDDTWEYGPTSPASWVTYGSACTGTAGMPAFAPEPYSLPWLGDTFVLRVQGIPAGQAAFVLFGSAQQWGPLTLPAPLGAFGMPGCTLFAGGDVLLFALAANGTATVPVVIPAAAALLGAVVHGQAAVTDPGANAAGLVVSPAGTLTVGGR